jgi:hypothetical protein
MLESRLNFFLAFFFSFMLVNQACLARPCNEQLQQFLREEFETPASSGKPKKKLIDDYWRAKIKEYSEMSPGALAKHLLHNARMIALRNVIGHDHGINAVPLSKLVTNHPIDGGPALIKTQKRAQSLKLHETEVRNNGVISAELLDKVNPSITPIQVLKADDGSYWVLEGVGRVLAARNAFDTLPDVKIEVQVYTVDTYRLRQAYIRYFEQRRRQQFGIPEGEPMPVP